MAAPLTHEVFVRCDPTTAFDLLADVRNETRWSAAVTAAEMHSDGPVRDGSTFTTVYRGVENGVTIPEYDRPDRLVVAAANKSMDVDTTYTFTEADGGTRIVVATQLRPKGFMSALAPLIRFFMRREVAQKYVTFRQAVENQPDLSAE